MSDLADFLNAQYDRIEKRERGKFTVPFRPDLRCPTCGRPVDETIHTSGEDRTRFEPCGHAMLNLEYAERYGKSNADLFVLADIESKREIVKRHSDPHGGDPSCSSLDYPESAEDCETLRLLAAPFSGEPGYDERWAV